MSDPLEFDSRDTPFPVALAGMIGIAKALFEGFYGVLGIAIASSVDDSFGAGALVFGIVYLIASIMLLRGNRLGYYATIALSVIGLLVLPAKRGTAKNELRTSVEAMRRRLMEALTAQFDHELTHSLARIREAISPYTRFVRSERERLTAAHEDFRRIRSSLERLRIELGGGG